MSTGESQRIQNVYFGNALKRTFDDETPALKAQRITDP